MRRIVILGSGAGGTIVANQLRGQLPEDEWDAGMIQEGINVLLAWSGMGLP